MGFLTNHADFRLGTGIADGTAMHITAGVQNYVADLTAFCK